MQGFVSSNIPHVNKWLSGIYELKYKKFNQKILNFLAWQEEFSDNPRIYFQIHFWR